MHPDIIGHRGARNEAPENSLPGFRHALGLGLTTVEFDVRLSRDHELMVIHDATVDRTTNGTGNVADLSRAELQSLDARAQFPDWPEPCTIPTLPEVLDLLGDRMAMMIEIKPDAPGRMEAIVRQLIPRIDDHGIGDRVTVTSFDPVALEIVQRLAPDQSRGYIGKWDTPEFLDTALRLGCAQADMNVTTSAADTVAAARDAGLRTIGWPCNDEATLETLRSWHVDAITTDEPTRIRKLLDHTT